MATKYVIEGATYCGDGTADNEAASAGAAGAWNVFLGASGVFENTSPAYGSLAAGDTVIVRSKTGNGVNANLTRTTSSNLSFGSSAATITNWITWIFDNGATWPGIDGTATCTTSADYVTFTIRDYNRVVCLTQDRLALKMGVNSNSNSLVVLGTTYAGSILENALIDTSAAVGYGPTAVSVGMNSKLVSPHVKQSLRYYETFRQGGYGTFTIINPDIELLNATQTKAVFQNGANGARIDVYGGQIRGAGASTGVAIADISGAGSSVNLYGTLVPADMAWPTTYPAATAPSNEFNAFGSDAKLGGMKMAIWGKADSNKTGNYPFLNATLPDSVSSGWSWKVWLENGSPRNVLALPIQGLFTGAAAAKTITLHMNVSDTMTTGDLLNQSNLWMEVMYVQDSDGAVRRLTTRAETVTALAAGPSSAWSASTYGSVSLVPKKLSITTPTAIRQDSVVQCVLCSNYGSAVASQIFFVDPAAELS